jgi:ubiquinone/menaquinone biosynthesis C-methylase UbiE
LGCGSGRNFSAMTHTSVSPAGVIFNNNSGQKKDVNLYAVDFSGEMIKFADKKAKELKLNAKIEKSESDKLSFEDNFFDSTICVAVLHCIDSKKKRVNTLKEIYRTLKPGSEAFISTWGKNSPRLKGKGKECFVSWSVKNDKESRKGEREIKQERYTYVYDLEELEKEVLYAGFKIEKIWEERNVNVIVRKE